jgi:ANTAR domain
VAEPPGRERAESLEAGGVLKDARIAELIHEIEGLHTAMEHRAAIEQAKGVIMNVMGCGSEAAFAASSPSRRIRTASSATLLRKSLRPRIANLSRTEAGGSAS